MDLLFHVRYPTYISYAVIGTPVFLINTFILLIIISDKGLRKKSAMIAGLAGANFFNGLHAFGYGLYRLPLLFSGSLDQPGSVWGCMGSLLPTCAVLGYTVPSAMQFVIGVERLVAIAAFNWYRVRWSPAKNWLVMMIIFGATACIWVIPLWYRVVTQVPRVTKECSSLALMGETALGLTQVISLLVNFAGIICVLSAVAVGHARFRRIVARDGGASADTFQFRRQLRLTKMMLLVATFDFGLVVLPILIGIIYAAVSQPVPFTLAAYGTVINCSNSISNIFIYLSMNANFRQVTMAKLGAIGMKCGCDCFGLKNKVITIQVSSQQQASKSRRSVGVA